ncbi:MAG: hypothetical protein R3A13_09005 [Bdellovibrionota bacterium]
MSNLELDDIIASDPTWKRSLDIANQYITVTTQTWQLVKSSWYGEADMTNFTRTISFSYLEPKCLLIAAGMDNPKEFEPQLDTLKQAIQFLGFKFSAVVLATNVACRMVMKTKPESHWKNLFQEMMTAVEIGYHMGAKCREVGLEAGALMGFAKYVGSAVLLASDHAGYKKWHLKKDEANSKALQREIFGCEDYQVAAIVLQKLGFGSNVALGASLGIGKLRGVHNVYTRDVLLWRAVIYWIEALQKGKPYPEETPIARFFPELAPPGKTAENLNLNALRDEISPILKEGSKWKWHLTEVTKKEMPEKREKKV